tara:strand:- start:16480 stop:17514 length:1035 start_codon:yes stop_codon:yes gene_type:complete
MKAKYTKFSEQKANFTLIMAPPGWGKTSLIIDLLEKSPANRVWVFISPLRALSEEFHERVNSQFRSWFIGSTQEGNEKIKSFRLPQIIILSPEVLQNHWIEKLLEKKEVGFIIDEVHLFFKWGETFRPKLLDSFYEILSLNLPVIALSATVSDSLKEEIKKMVNDNKGNFEELNFGNFEFMNPPKRELSFGSNDTNKVNRLFLRMVLKKSRKRFLLFCKTREEVNNWLLIFQQRKISAIGAVGGEVKSFRENLLKQPDVKVIISTSVLGHGVNLPSLDFLFINYHVADYGLWLQMASRAGRRGEDFCLISCKHLKGIKGVKNKLKTGLIDYYFQFDTFFERITG